jgi:hypothetical protein
LPVPFYSRRRRRRRRLAKQAGPEQGRFDSPVLTKGYVSSEAAALPSTASLHFAIPNSDAKSQGARKPSRGFFLSPNFPKITSLTHFEPDVIENYFFVLF